MCYCVYLSTTSDADLACANTERITFEREGARAWEDAAGMLAFEHRWYVSWMGACSCGLRHAMDPALGFGEPEDWFPEDPEGLEDTRLLYRVIEGLVRSGHAVDCLDVWVGADAADVQAVEVRLADVPEGALRFFENHLFRFMAA